jgi:hypothetical protein
LRDAFIRGMRDLPEITQAKIDAEGIGSVLRMRNLTETLRFQETMAGRRVFDDLYKLRNSGQITEGDFSTRVKAEFERQTKSWKMVYNRELMVHSGIVKKLGLENAVAIEYINGIEAVQRQWTEFQESRRIHLNEYFNMARTDGETKKAYQARRRSKWAEVQGALDTAYTKAADFEAAQARLTDDLFVQGFTAQTQQDPARVRAWLDDVRKRKSELRTMMAEFREAQKNLPYTVSQEAWNRFVEGFNAKIIELDNLERTYSMEILQGTPLQEQSLPVINSVVQDIVDQTAQAKHIRKFGTQHEGYSPAATLEALASTLRRS